MPIRRATESDLPGIAAARRSNGPAHDDSGADAGYCRHLLAEGHLWVATQDDVVLGFAGAVDVGGARLLSDLYVHADAHGRGVGSGLLTAVLDGAASRFTFASDDPAALAMYARAGMLAWWPLLSLRGSGDGLRAEGAVAYDIDITHAAQFEQRSTGFDRSVTFRYWAARKGSRTVGVDLGGLVAVASVRTAGRSSRIEHLVAADQHASAAVAAIGSLVGRDDVHLYVPGCRPLAAALLGARFVVDGVQFHMASSPGVVPDAVQVVHPGLA
ncbi:MAG: GNAT family N-acetyltransferase [Ilumatobacteraceae bacterium]